MFKKSQVVQRVVHGSRWLAAIVLSLSAVMPLMASQTVKAAQVTTRSIKLSSSAAGATSTTYLVTFNAATTNTVAGIVLDFCANSPIIGDTTCTTPTGFTLTASPAVSGQSANISTLTTAGTLNSNRTLTLTGSGGSVSAGATVTFAITTVTNPTTANQTFYARVYTYATSGGATSYTVASPGSYIDSGGFALSTAAQITITAKVQEQLTFCVYTGANCAAGGTAVNLGDSNGVLALYTTTYSDTSTKFDIATNAQSGAIVNLKMDTLKSGSNSIAAQGAACTADSTSNTVAQFGLRISTVTAPTVAVAPYNCAASNHGLDTNASTGTLSTYGQTIANTGGSPLVTTTDNVEFAAKASITTPAGIYTTTATFIATGTY